MKAIQVSIDELKTLIKTRFLQNRKNPKMRPRSLYIEGHAGIGKSEVVRQCSEELALGIKEPVGYMVLNLQFMERPDFMGLAYVDTDKRTKFATPCFLPQEGSGIILLDEANRVDQDIRSGLLTLLQDREINGNKIGDGWLIVMAGNPAEAGEGEGTYEVNELDTALQDRMSKVVLNPNIEGLTKYLEKKYGTSEPLVQLLKKSQNIISFTGAGISPRAYEYLIRALIGVPDLEMRKIISAAEIGLEASIKLNHLLAGGLLGYIELLQIEDGERETRFQKIIDKHDQQGFLLDELLKDFDLRLTEKRFYTERERQNIAKFIDVISAELKMALLTKVQKSNTAKQFFDQFIKGTKLATRFAHLIPVRGT